MGSDDVGARLRLLMPATEYPPARGYGLARYASELAAALAGEGAEVHVVSMNHAGGNLSREEDGVTVHLATDLDNPQHYSWVSGTVTGNIWLLERAQQVMREHGPFDAVLAHDWLGALAAKALKTMHGLPLVFFMHDTEPGKRGNRLTAEQLYVAEVETWISGYADAVIVNSESLREELRRFHKVEDVTVVPPGVRPERFETDCHLPDFKALFAGPDEKLVLYVGRLSPMKGVDILVEAAPAVLKRRPKTRFLVAGEGVLQGRLRKRAGELGVAEGFRFAGHLTGQVLAAAYRAADLAVVPSRYEPFGLVALEAMSCGTPVVAADVGGLKEIVPGDGLTRRFGAGNVEALVASLVAALGDEVSVGEREKLRARAAGFTWKRAAEAVLDVCGQVIAGRETGA